MRVLKYFMSTTAALVLAVSLLPSPANAADNRHRPLTTLCLHADPNCTAALNAALQSLDTPPEVVVTATGHANNFTSSRGLEPLRFQKRAPWVRRLETLGKEGLPFVRVPRGPESELVVGINRKGVLGFELKQVSNR